MVPPVFLTDLLGSGGGAAAAKAVGNAGHSDGAADAVGIASFSAGLLKR